MTNGFRLAAYEIALSNIAELIDEDGVELKDQPNLIQKIWNELDVLNIVSEVEQ